MGPLRENLELNETSYGKGLTGVIIPSHFNRLMLGARPSKLLAKLIEDPNLIQTVRALGTQEFSDLVKHLGVEDAGEIVAFATTEQLIRAFDEDLFVNDAPGEREAFSAERFVIWLEVLLEAGDEVVANRITELSFDFVVHALHSIVLVLDHDALLLSMSEGGPAAFGVDKALESALSEEIDGYLLISRMHDGWDAVMSLILALDRNHRDFLEQILDRCSAIASEYVDDLDALSSLLTLEESLAEDVESEREERRSRLGYVEPRDARAFLELAKKPLSRDIATAPRDPITNSHFRDLDRRAAVIGHTRPISPPTIHSPGEPQTAKAPKRMLSSGSQNDATSVDPFSTFAESMQILNNDEPSLFGKRMEELAYLANVISSGASYGSRRFRASEATEAVIATVVLGIEIEATRGKPSSCPKPKPRTTAREMRDILARCKADILFRRACHYLTTNGISTLSPGIVPDRETLNRLLVSMSI